MESKDLGIENEFPVLNFAPEAYFKKKSQDDPGWRVNQVWLMAGGGVCGDPFLTVIPAGVGRVRQCCGQNLYLPIIKQSFSKKISLAELIKQICWN